MMAMMMMTTMIITLNPLLYPLGDLFITGILDWWGGGGGRRQEDQGRGEGTLEGEGLIEGEGLFSCLYSIIIITIMPAIN